MKRCRPKFSIVLSCEAVWTNAIALAAVAVTGDFGREAGGLEFDRDSLRAEWIQNENLLLFAGMDHLCHSTHHIFLRILCPIYAYGAL